MKSSSAKIPSTSIADRIAVLRAHMKSMGGDAMIVPRADEYQNEYPPLWAERLAWATGFTGSAGVAVIGLEKAIVMSDARYTIQLRQQCDPAIFTVANTAQMRVTQWLQDNMKAGQVVLYDPRLHSKQQIDAWHAALADTGILLQPLTDNPIDAAWDAEGGRPSLPDHLVAPFPERLAGRSAAEKRQMLADILRKEGQDATLMTAQDSIAWLLNIRGTDVPHTPLALSTLILHNDGQVTWFIPPHRIPDTLRQALGNAVTIRAPQEVDQVIAGLRGKTVRIGAGQCSMALFNTLVDADISVVAGPDLCLLPRACKTLAEQDAMRAAHIRDGVAMVTTLHWLDSQIAAGADLDEISIGAQFTAIRARVTEFRDTSFDPIVGFNANGAIIHYRAENDPASAAKVRGDGLLLIDSGAQYSDGTTDITRTVAVNTVTAQMRAAYTAVLRGHIALSMAVFPHGTTGLQLDALTRAPLWAAGLDYPHGTGHGVGCYLSVHEEAGQGISTRGAAPILPGMILSNEPGYYREGAFGIRIENLILCQTLDGAYDDGRARCGFETITLCPYDRRLIDIDALTAAEKDWLNAYHARVRATLGPLLPPDVAAWVVSQTEKLA